MCVKKRLAIIGVIMCLFIVASCSQQPKMVVAENPKTYSQPEVDQESLKAVKVMFKHLDRGEGDKLYKDVQNYNTTFVEWTPTYYKQWDSQKFIKKFSGLQYGTHTQLSIIPPSDWSQNFKELDYTHKTLILARYTGDFIENYSLIIPVVYDTDNRVFKTNMIERINNDYVSSIKKESLKKYQMTSLPYRYESNNQVYTDNANYIEDTFIVNLIKSLHAEDPRKFGRYISSIKRKDANKFLVTTNNEDIGKDEILIELYKMETEKVKWIITQYQTGEVLWKSENWNE